MYAATPRRLKDGTWGAAVRNRLVAAGDVITVTTKSGKSWEAVVSHVVWRGPDVSIVATKSAQRGGARTSREPGYCYHMCPVGRFLCCPKNGPCHDCE